MVIFLWLHVFATARSGPINGRLTCLLTGESQECGGVFLVYAIIETGGKQYRVEPGKILTVEKLNADVGSQVDIETVLAAKNEAMFKVGQPYVQGARVRATVLEHGKGRKIVVFKYKPKKNYKKKQGHRQPFTRIRIDEILF